MTKKLVWTEALGAYDRDFDVLEATRSDYAAFLAQTRDDVIARVKQLSGEAFMLDAWTHKDVDAVGEWKPAGHGELSGLVVQVVQGAGMGIPGTIQVFLWLDAAAAIPRELGALELRNALRDAATSLPGEAFDPAKHAGSSNPEVVNLHHVGVELEAKDLVEQLTMHVLEYCRAAQRLSDSIALVSHTSDPYRWARARLLEIRVMREEELTAKGKWEWDPKDVKLDTWADGRYLGVRRWKDGETDDLWVTAMPDGEVVFAAYGPTTGDKARWKALRGLAVGDEREVPDGRGATLLTARAVRGMAEAGKTREMCDRVVKLFQVFLAG